MASSELVRPRMNDLPPEIVHITEGYIPLSRLLTRLAQSTHNQLQSKIMELANMPASAMVKSGTTTTQAANGSDDTSPENLKKKMVLMQFAQEMHTQWVKALVITDWSRKAGMASKLVDLKSYLDQQRLQYDTSIDFMINVRRNLPFAQLPSPDLKTAFHVLTTGDGSYMPDFNYIEPPPLTENELHDWVTEIDTLLTLRLNLTDHDKIPLQFRDYTIASGRVTFRVKGEFEVDLTVADEDEEKQFWFLDFRFDFAPAPDEPSDAVRGYLELLVNKVLADDGLAGCYKFLHEFVLTHKINELKRQALMLRTSSWTKSLKVEPLQRALAIEYWASRVPPNHPVPKHWVLIGVNSGSAGGQFDPTASSSIVLKWYRDGKEVSDVDIPINLENLSVEGIMVTVITKHIHHILSIVNDKFVAVPRPVKRAPGDLVLSPPETPLAEMSFSIRAGARTRISLMVDPITGSLSVASRGRLLRSENKILKLSKVPTQDGMQCLEQARWRCIAEDISREAGHCNWTSTRPSLSGEVVASRTQIRAPHTALFFQRKGWRPEWHLMAHLSTMGDTWWAVRTYQNQASFMPLAIDTSESKFGVTFWNNLAVLVTGVIAKAIAKTLLLPRSITIMEPDDALVGTVPGVPNETPVPALLVRLSDLIPDLAARMSATAEAPPVMAPVAPAPMHAIESGPSAELPKLDLALPNRTSTPNPKVRDAGRDRTPPSTPPRQSGPWLHEMAMVTFKGVEPHPPSIRPILLPPQAADAPNSFYCVSTVTLRVLNPTFFRSLHNKPLGGDVVYSLQNGEFSFRVYHHMGVSALDIAVARTRALDRLVSFVDVMHRVPPGIDFTTIQLDKVQFTYPGTPTVSGKTASDPPKFWPVTFDLSGDAIRIKLDPGDPHAPLADYMSLLANSSNGIASLMKYLPVTSDLCAAFSAIVRAWTARVPSGSPARPLPSQTPRLKTKKLQKGQAPPSPPKRVPNVRIQIHGLDWLTLRYDIVLRSGARRIVCFHAKILYHNQDPWWHVSHVTTNSAKNASTTNTANVTSAAGPGPDDPLSAALKKTCAARGVPFKALGSAVAAQPSKGTFEMIMALDACVKAVARPPQAGGPPPPRHAAPPVWS